MHGWRKDHYDIRYYDDISCSIKHQNASDLHQRVAALVLCPLSSMLHIQDNIERQEGQGRERVTVRQSWHMVCTLPGELMCHLTTAIFTLIWCCLIQTAEMRVVVKDEQINRVFSVIYSMSLQYEHTAVIQRIWQVLQLKGQRSSHKQGVWLKVRVTAGNTCSASAMIRKPSTWLQGPWRVFP